MSDVFTKAKRSAVMSRIRSRGNAATELALMKLLRQHKITGWRRHLKLRVTGGKWQVTRKNKKHTLPRPSPRRGEGEKCASAPSPVTRHSSLAVRPDFVFLKSRTAIFVDGCFWHGCPRHGTQPKGNRSFWKKKFARNLARDRLVNRALRRTGWRVLRIWEHTLRWATKDKRSEARLVRRILGTFSRIHLKS
jgi:DNA mismatch endonuclease (patch repair protein)